MKEAIKRYGRQWVTALGVAAVSVYAALPASAQVTVTEPDYATIVNTGKAELFDTITAVGPLIFGLLAVMLGVRWAWNKFSRAAGG